MLFPFPGLREDVGHGSANLPDDVLNVKRSFAALDRMREPPEGFHMFTEKPLTDAIERFQQDRALSVDGFMNPGGETERNLKRDLGLGPPDVPMDLAELKLSGPVGNALANQPRDLRAVSKALGKLGLFNYDRTAEPPPTISKQLDDAIQGFQGSNGLLADGEVNPGGETIRTLAAAVAQKQGGGQGQAGAPQLAQQPATKPKAGSGGPRDDGRNPDFSRFRQNLKPWEGGFANRGPKADPGGPTQKGISQKFLDNLNRQNPRWGLPKDTNHLTDDQIDGIYRKEFFDRPNIQKVTDVPGLKQQAPKLAEQLFDSGLLHGLKNAGRFLQESLDQVLGTDLRVADTKGGKVHDGIVGSGTRTAIARAVREGKAAAVNNVMVDKRIAVMRTLKNFKNNSGWVPRAESFRMPIR